MLLQSFSSYVTPRMRPVGSGASSDFEQRLYGQATVQLGNSKEANKLIVKARASYSRMNEAFAIFADGYLRDNKETFSLKNLNDAFDKSLQNDRAEFERIIGTSNIFSDDDGFSSAVKNGQLKEGDVYYNNDTSDANYGTYQIVTPSLFQQAMEF